MIIFVLLLLFCFLAWFKPKYALGAVLALLPTYQIQFQILNIPFTFLEAMILLLFVIYFGKNIKKIKEIKEQFEGWQWPIMAWLVVATVSMFISPDLRAAAGVWKAYFIEPVLFLILLLSLIKDRKDLQIIYAAVFFSVYYLGFFALYQKLSGGGVLSLEVWGGEKILRVTGLFPHPNFLGLFLGPLIVLAFGQIVNFESKKFLSPLNGFILLFLGISALFFSRSEGAIIGVAAGLIFYLLFFKKIRKYVLIGLTVAVLLVAIYPIPRQYFLEKALLRDLSGQFRVNIWRGATSLLKTSPILGVGLDGYEKLIPDYQAKNFIADNGEKLFAPPQPYPHNLFLTVWLETGLAGLLVLVWILIKFFIQGFKDLKNDDIILNSAAMGAMVVVLIHGLVDTPYFKNDLAIVFWLIVGLMIILRRGARVDESGALEKH